MTEFQKRVYKAVEQIPCGRVVTYGEAARMAGSPRSSRAVGNILHKNPFFGVVPCQRVVHAEGVTFTEEGKVDMQKHGYIFD